MASQTRDMLQSKTRRDKEGDESMKCSNSPGHYMIPRRRANKRLRGATDTVGSGEDLNTSSATEEEEETLASSHEDQQTDKEPLSFLPPLPHLSSLPSTVPPPSDQAFLQAAAIFQQLRTEKSVTKQRLHYGKKKTDTTQPETGDETPQRQAYHLAFNTLKCVKSLIIVV
ncbi:hypothetical protein D9C73_002228 [Collichthys lucidus]|uniref:Uncharacterized protein n=1 Tax=Collichthys lucidus TaxID=240159 RepID=A0A4U5U251_COLLU|nr:hypothetical protein D9C73_002228 [Collichthys lucidus]